VANGSGQAGAEKFRARLIIVVAILNLCAFYYLLVSSRAAQDDFVLYYVWSWLLRKNLSPYSAASMQFAAHSLGVAVGTSNYPPLFLLLFEPLTLLNFGIAFRVWHGINLILLVVSLFGLMAKVNRREDRLYVIGLALLYGPLCVNLFWGQSQIILLFLLVMSLLCSRRGFDYMCGAALTIAGLLKIYPLFVLGYFLVLRRWRVLMSSIIVTLGLACLSIALFGTKVNLQFLSAVRAGNLGVNSSASISLLAVVTKAFWMLTGRHVLSAGMDLARVGTISAVMIAVAAMTVRATACAAGTRNEETAYGLWVAAAVLLSPIGWVHHMALLLIPTVQRATSYLSRSALRLGCCGYWLAEIGLVIFWLRELVHPPYLFLVITFPAVFFSSLVLTFASVFCESTSAIDEEMGTCSGSTRTSL
jgi:hypothetical protein